MIPIRLPLDQVGTYGTIYCTMHSVHSTILSAPRFSLNLLNSHYDQFDILLCLTTPGTPVYLSCPFRDRFEVRAGPTDPMAPL